jgi:hypothetical protein
MLFSRAIVVLPLTLLSCSTEPDFGIEPRKQDSTAIAILVVNFQNFAFEGARVSHFPQTGNTQDSSLPFVITQKNPTDFGWILFSYRPTGDTVLAASIVWHGQGRILYPDSFAPVDSFQLLGTSVQQPSSVERFVYLLTFSDDSLVSMTDSVWASIRNLDIVHDFGQANMRVGYYVYPPTVGPFNPSHAKWIVFLCTRR